MKLSDQLDADLDVFFDTETGFAVNGTVTIGGVNSTVSVILDTPYALSSLLAEAENSELVFHGRKSQFANAKKGDKLVVSGITYWFISTPQDTGDSRVVKLALSREQI